jgi:hypothetical protein
LVIVALSASALVIVGYFLNTYAKCFYIHNDDVAHKEKSKS